MTNFHWKMIALGASILLSSQAWSADHQVEVCTLQAHHNSDNVYLRPCGNWSSQNGCGSDYYLAWNRTDFGGEQMYATAMAALLGDKSVQLRLDGSSCIGSYDHVHMVRIIK